ncbi:ankyrin repeat domain-containing protein [Maridesulfovibrio salexigens]|uniref:Ankyrin n=1 Tax=Maridesulfovibrio salexigens (strain ATCC 14822 / DSM 2638 / NCIMB 8403 / VKM B-1763) TaxID=526222 RepID=C6BTI7_MARSD|nr:ankyrin repeat domain-containing protein [Maridesulfovibrio salexigens]ACS81668.1 Ankyrin [Maridesulfovibrio salexigens DSM 2638]
MTIRKWTILTISTLAALIFALIFTVNIVIDPYGEFRLIEGKYNKLKFKSLKSTARNVASKLYEGKYTLVFGSSRTMLISEEILGEPVLNFSTSIYNNPGDILALLNTLDEKQVKNIQQIYYLIDINSFHYENSAPELSSKSTLFLESFRNIGPDKIADAWKCIIDNLGPKSEQPNFIDEFGVLHKEGTSYKNNAVVFSSHSVTNYYLDKLSKINNFSKSHNIKTIYFTLPWKDKLPPLQQDKLDTIFGMISHIISTYYDFNKDENLGLNQNFFSDPTHLNSKGLKKLFKGQHWTNPKTTVLKKYTQPNFKIINKNDFFKYIDDNQNSISIDFVNQLLRLGRDDLVLAIYDEKVTTEAFVRECFFLNKTSLLKTLLSSGRNYSKSPYMNNLALYFAIMSGQHSSVKDAILLGADVNNNLFNTTPLLHAMDFTKNTEILSLLLGSGADINYTNKNSKTDFKQSVFTIALAKNNQKQLDFLLSYAPDSPLAEHARLVLELKKNPNNATAYKRYSTLQNKYYSN